MAQDLRELLKHDRKNTVQGKKMLPNHQERFLARLEKELPPQKKESNHFYWMKIAAILIVVAVSAVFIKNQFFNSTSSEIPMMVNEHNTLSTTPVLLSDVSPEFKKVEDFYLANINTELAKLTITDENKELIDSFMMQLEELDQEYIRLNKELKETSVNEESINLLINNLQLRLDLLSKLKSKLYEIKNIDNSTLGTTI
ncbi:hypothetical protein [Mesonia sp. K7]|uniref:hypothetical protein n=1 Tax=Mesonia sp. K7 TaxID=2218606 RepID=UPI000DA991B1|nr:hypothetical protein [Mesonia sp. K7]PZD79525.1 hypothetical protein DNG35_00515 [Mesonia sp. K7]